MDKSWRRFSKWLLILVSMGASQGAWAGSITSSLDRTEGGVEDLFVMTVTIEGSREGDLQIPEVDGLTIQQRGVSQSMSFVNGQSRQEMTVNYVIQAAKAGAYMIPSLSMELDGQKESTLPLTITVAANPTQASPPTTAKGAKPRASEKNTASAQNATGIMVERECDKTQVYVGEQILCAVRIYHRGNLAGGQRLGQNSTEYRRFSIEGEKQYQKVVNGQRYAVIELKEIVVPLKVGAIAVAPFELDARVIAWNRRGNPLDKFFDRMGGGMFNFDMAFTQESQALLKSEPTPLDVKPLPSAGRPPHFSGLIGQYQMSVQKSTDRLAAGDTVTITIILEGTGPLDTATNPMPDIGQGGKVYADKPDYKEQLNADTGIQSAKTFKYAFVPSQPGQITLPPVEVSVFNPRLGQYVTLHGDLGALIVDPAKAEQKPLVLGQPLSVATPQQSVKALDHDLLGLHREENLATSHTITTFEKVALLTINAISSLTPLTALIFITRRRRNSTNTGALRRSRALKEFRAQMALSQKVLAAGQVSEALNASYLALRTYLGDKCGKQGAALTERDIESLLGQCGASDNQRRNAQEFVLACEKAAFGGMLLSRESAETFMSQVTSLIEELEKHE